MSTITYPGFGGELNGAARPGLPRSARSRTARSFSQGPTALAPASTRLVLTRRGRRVIAFLVALPLALAALFAVVATGDAAATNSSGVVVSDINWVTVDAGETLWGLAERVAPTKDPRDVIAEIMSLNQIQGDLQPGQRIALPPSF